ncbi:M42 family metallopeptidase [soil metagenome]
MKVGNKLHEEAHMNLRDDVLRYSRFVGPSGAEDNVIRAFTEDLRSLGVEPSVDPLGNVSAALTEAQPGYPHVMVTAHLDEVGVVVRKIEDGGYLRIHRVGGTNDRVVAGQRFVFLTTEGPVEGVVGVKAKHVSSPAELSAAVMIDDAYVDIMAVDKHEVTALGVDVGTLGVFLAEPIIHNNFIRGKALDDRAGIAMLLEMARRVCREPPRAGVTLVATVQEEFSVRGGVPAARRVNPDLAFCLDIAIATDTPDLSYLGDVKLGGGPVITRFTRASLNGIIPNPKLHRFVADIAKTEGISVQNAVLQGGLTDGSFMQYEGNGIPTLDLGFATRYTHTPVETCHLRDLEQGVDLLCAVLKHFPKDFDLSRG